MVDQVTSIKIKMFLQHLISHSQTDFRSTTIWLNFGCYVCDCTLMMISIIKVLAEIEVLERLFSNYLMFQLLIKDCHRYILESKYLISEYLTSDPQM